MSEWRMLAARLVADAQVIGGAIGPNAPLPTPPEAAEFLRSAHHVIDRLTSVSIRIGKAYGDRLPEAELGQFRVAAQHMQAVSLERVADALDRLPADGPRSASRGGGEGI